MTDSPRLITEYDVARAANKLLKLVEPHYRYPDPVPVYVKNGEPSCIVAFIVAGMGLPYQKLIENIKPSSQPDLGVAFTPQAAALLDEMQYLQDAGNEWEDVVFYAFERMPQYGLTDYLRKL